MLFICSLAGGNTPCKMCLVAQGPNSLLVFRWCLHAVTDATAVPVTTIAKARFALVAAAVDADVHRVWFGLVCLVLVLVFDLVLDLVRLGLCVR